MKLELHDYRRCPFCIRVRIILELKKIPYERIHEPLREWTPWMIQNIKKPRVPVLHVIARFGKNIIIPESNEINLWLDKNFGTPLFTPQDNSLKYQQMLEWWEWCADDFKPQIDLLKYGKDRIFDEELHKEYTEELSAMIQKIEDALSRSAYLLGEQMTLADIAIIPFVRQIMRTRNGEFEFAHYPRVLLWSAGILEEEWFNDIVMAKN